MQFFRLGELNDRTWPDRTITKAPRWLSTDLAAPGSMSAANRFTMFELLVRMGYKEIEVGEPSSRQADFDFVRRLVDENRIPDDVRICVLTPAGDEHLARTVQALSGVRRATVNLHDLGLARGTDLAERHALAVRATEHLMKMADEYLIGCDLGYEYSAECSAGSGLEFALEVGAHVMDTWRDGAGGECILNVPRAESTPNVFADHAEWMSRHLPRRAQVCLSVRPHNDYGTAVANAEFAVMAGADRVAGRLFGGAGQGRACLVTLGLNLHSQGVDPHIDFSDIDRIRRTVEECTGLRVHERHPYAGDLVYTSFAGSHQDAINKGLEVLEREAAAAGIPVQQFRWTVPYLPIDPRDVGRSYEAIIRVNSQSGKGGVAYLMKAEHDLDLPRRLQIEFSRVVQEHTETGGEVTAAQMWEIFKAEYLAKGELCHFPNVPVALLIRALSLVGIDVRVLDRYEHGCPGADGAGASPKVAHYVECRVADTTVWGVGIDTDPQVAQRRAILSAVRRAGHLPAERAFATDARVAAGERRQGAAAVLKPACRPSWPTPNELHRRQHRSHKPLRCTPMRLVRLADADTECAPACYWREVRSGTAAA